MAMAYAVPGSKVLVLFRTGSGVSLGKSWYLFGCNSGACCIFSVYDWDVCPPEGVGYNIKE